MKILALASGVGAHVKLVATGESSAAEVSKIAVSLNGRFARGVAARVFPRPLASPPVGPEVTSGQLWVKMRKAHGEHF
jgi:hypothetical protein